MEHYDKPDPRRLKHGDAVSTRTRGEKMKHPNMYPEGHVHMDDAYHKATRKYNAWKRATKKAARGTGGRRRYRKHRSTRRR